MKWIKADPLGGFSSLHKGQLWNFKGRRIGCFSSVFSFNFETPLSFESLPTLTFHSRPVDQPTMLPRVDFCIDQLTQWVLDLSPFKCFNDYVGMLNYKKRQNYRKTEECFTSYGCKTTIVEGDWSDYADKAFELYNNVAAKHMMRIYDRDFFRAIAKQADHKLICAWHGEKLIGTLVVSEDASTAHSMGCGLDYIHSNKSFAYSKLHYEFIRLVIAAGKFKLADAGVTADQAKKTLGFAPRPAVIEISAKGILLRAILRLSRRLVKLSLDPQNAIRVSMRWSWIANKISKRFYSAF